MRFPKHLCTRHIGPTTSALRTSGLILMLWFVPVTSVAQTSGSFENLRESLPPGSEVTVTRTDGGVTRGQIISVSPTTLGLASGVDRANFSREQIREIRHHTRGPIGNGTLWGMLIGGALGAGVGAVGGYDRGQTMVLFGAGALVGSPTGILVDLLREESRVAYRAVAAQEVTARARSGIRVSFRF